MISESLVSSLSAAENQLASYLLNASRYSPDVRPVINYEDKLIVWHGLKLAQLIKLVGNIFPFFCTADYAIFDCLFVCLFVYCF